MKITVTAARLVDRELVTGLFSQYLEEITALGAGFWLDEQGRWQPDHLPYWLSEGDDHHTLVLREAARPVGLAFVLNGTSAYIATGRDFCLSEFFVVPEARRRGVGSAAARVVFDRFRGRWEVYELPDNRRAIAFWRRVIADYTGGAFEEIELTERGGPTQCFDNS